MMSTSWRSMAILAALIVGEVISIYQVLFCLWMLSYPLYSSPDWSARLKVRLLTAIVLGGLIAFVAVRRRR